VADRFGDLVVLVRVAIALSAPVSVMVLAIGQLPPDPK
jgi:hypothetical protein